MWNTSLAADQGPDLARELAAIAGSKLFQALATIAMQRFIISDVLTEEQSFHAIDVENSLGNQRLPLSTDPAAILFLWCRYPDH